jgi:hypothetical protein
MASVARFASKIWRPLRCSDCRSGVRSQSCDQNDSSSEAYYTGVAATTRMSVQYVGPAT